MKNLVLFCHAKSSWNPVADMHRPLDGRGLYQVWHMACHCTLAGADKILSSPAARGLCSAMIYLDRLQLRPSILEIHPAIYESCEGDLLDVISVTDNPVHTLWLFGHNPGLNLLLDRLLGRSTDNLVTAAYVHLCLDASSWQKVSFTKATLIQWNQNRG